MKRTNGFGKENGKTRRAKELKERKAIAEKIRVKQKVFCARCSDKIEDYCPRVSCYFLCFYCLCCLRLIPVYAARIKELGYLNGVRNNQLIGYGLLVGLNGTGDKSNTLFTNQSLANMLDSLGVKVDPRTTKVNNIAAVMITANLPPFAKIGNKIDAT